MSAWRGAVIAILMLCAQIVKPPFNVIVNQAMMGMEPIVMTKMNVD